MRLIDADEIIKKLRSVIAPANLFGIGVSQGIHEAIRELLDAPTIEAEPVRHRTWVIKTHDDGYGEYEVKHCPDCDRGLPTTYDASYCPNCGAKMDGEEKKE